jgi:hypothetical protein
MRKVTPTASIEAEQSVLGGLMLDNRKWADVSRIVSDADFYEQRHKLIFAAMRALMEKGIPIDVITLATALEDAGLIEQAGGWTYLGKLPRDTPSAANIDHYATIVRIRALERRREAAIEKEDHDQAAVITATIKVLQSQQPDKSLLADYVSAASLDKYSFSRTWLVEKFLEQGRVYEFFGKYKEGKTLAVIDLAASLSLAHLWANRRTVQCLVVWVAGEAVDDVKMRLQAWRLHYGVTEPMPFYIRVKPVYLTDQEFASRLASEIELWKQHHPELPVLLVLDTVARCMAPGADENSILGLGAFINNLLDLVARPCQATAICVHHAGHGDSERSRGHSSFPAAVDGSVKVSMDRSQGPPIISVTPVTSRSTPGDDRFSFRLEVQELPGEDNFGNPVSSPVLRYLEDYTPLAPVEPVGKTAREVLSLLQLLSVGKEEEGILVTRWRQAFYDLKSDSTADARRQAWLRALRDLQERGLVELIGVNHTQARLPLSVTRRTDER